MKTQHTPTLETGVPVKEVTFERYEYADYSTVNTPAVRLYCVQHRERYCLQIRGIDHRKQSWMANAELDANNPIVRAVNAHQELLGALKGARMLLVGLPADSKPMQHAYDLIDDAIAKAEGK